MIIETLSAEETQKAGFDFASTLKEGDTIALEGDVGAGKTEFVRGIISYFYPEAPVRSPSFSLVNSYKGDSLEIHHFDFYRIEDVNELWEIGFDEYIHSNAVTLIEWAQLFPEVLPQNRIDISFKECDSSKRVIEFKNSPL